MMRESWPAVYALNFGALRTRGEWNSHRSPLEKFLLAERSQICQARLWGPYLDPDIIGPVVVRLAFPFPSGDENHDHNAKNQCPEWVNHCQTVMSAGAVHYNSGPIVSGEGLR